MLKDHYVMKALIFFIVMGFLATAFINVGGAYACDEYTNLIISEEEVKENICAYGDFLIIENSVIRGNLQISAPYVFVQDSIIKGNLDLAPETVLFCSADSEFMGNVTGGEVVEVVSIEVFGSAGGIYCSVVPPPIIWGGINYSYWFPDSPYECNN